MTRSRLFDLSQFLSSQENALTIKLRFCAMIDSLDEQATAEGYTLNWPKIKIESEIEATDEYHIAGAANRYDWNRLWIHLDGVKEDEPA